MNHGIKYGQEKELIEIKHTTSYFRNSIF